MLRSGTMYKSDSTSEINNFEIWKDNVDNIVFDKLNLHCHDLPDEDYWMNWHNKMSPQQMANYIIQNTYDMLEHFNNNITKN